jgi:hypothetical protein
LKVAWLKTDARELLDRTRIHDPVEHLQDARQQLLQKDAGISMHP